MGGVVSGILIVSVVIAVGYLAARLRILGPEVQGALTRTAYYVTNPALLFTVVAGSDIRAALGTDAPLALLSAAIVGLLYWLASFLFFRRPAAETAVGAMASSYANANNIGIPVSLYAVGTAQHVAPVLLVQLLVMAPFYLTVLALVSGSKISWKKMLLQPLGNPIIIASALGVAVALTGWTAPDLLQKPIDMLAGGAVPMVLLAFGLSLAGRAPLQKDDGRTETLGAWVRSEGACFDDDEDVSGKGDAAAAAAVPKATAQRNFTDPDARIMKTADGSYHYCYNGQGVVDSGHQVIVATELNNTAVDVQQLIPMVQNTQDTLETMPRKWSADAGYCSAANLEHVKDLEASGGTEFFISTRRMKHRRPVPEAPRGRIPADATLTERMARKLKTKKGRAVYARRKAIVEPVFGQINTRQGKHVLLRGLEKASAEWKLMAGCHNLLKLFSYRSATA